MVALEEFERPGVIQQESELFAALYQSHIREIYAYCLRRIPEQDAQDAAAEVFMVVWRRRADLPPGDAALPWIYGIARNIVSNRRRSVRRSGRLEARLRGLRSVSHVGQDEADRCADRSLVLAALSKLSEREQETIRLIEWEGLDRGQVASLFGVSRAAIDQRLSRAYKKLERLLPDDPTGLTRTDGHPASGPTADGLSRKIR